MATDYTAGESVAYLAYFLVFAVGLAITYAFQKHNFSNDNVADTNTGPINQETIEEHPKQKVLDTEPISPLINCCTPLSPIKTPTSFKRKKQIKPSPICKSKENPLRPPLMSISTNTLEATARLNFELNQVFR